MGNPETKINIIPMTLALLIIMVSLIVIFRVPQLNLPWDFLRPQPPPTGKDTWAYYYPEKCVEIPWRQAWANQNGKLYSQFPLESELNFIKEYYTQRGLVIKQVKLVYVANPESICNECGCQENFAYEILTNQRDAAILRNSGFTTQKDVRLYTDVLFR